MLSLLPLGRLFCFSTFAAQEVSSISGLLNFAALFGAQQRHLAHDFSFVLDGVLIGRELKHRHCLQEYSSCESEFGIGTTVEEYVNVVRQVFFHFFRREG